MSFANALKSAQLKNNAEIKPPAITRSQLKTIVENATNIEKGDPATVPPEYRNSDLFPRIEISLSRNRIELYFEKLPTKTIRESLKFNKFWWDGDRKCWHNFDTATVRSYLENCFNADFGEDPRNVLNEPKLMDAAHEHIAESRAAEIIIQREAPIPDAPKELPSDEKTLERYRDQVDELITHLSMRPGDLIILAVDCLHKATFSKDA